jgi:hypothetical protein
MSGRRSSNLLSGGSAENKKMLFARMSFERVKITTFYFFFENLKLLLKKMNWNTGEKAMEWHLAAFRELDALETLDLKEKRQAHDSDWCYILQADDKTSSTHALIKVGFSQDFVQRRGQYPTCCPLRLTTIGLIQTAKARKIEAALKRIWHEWQDRSGGGVEWFRVPISTLAVDLGRFGFAATQESIEKLQKEALPRYEESSEEKDIGEFLGHLAEDDVRYGDWEEGYRENSICNCEKKAEDDDRVQPDYCTCVMIGGSWTVEHTMISEDRMQGVHSVHGFSRGGAVALYLDYYRRREPEMERPKLCYRGLAVHLPCAVVITKKALLEQVRDVARKYHSKQKWSWKAPSEYTHPRSSCIEKELRKLETQDRAGLVNDGIFA